MGLVETFAGGAWLSMPSAVCRWKGVVMCAAVPVVVPAVVVADGAYVARM